ncbi:MAG: hypothetical protein DMD42_05895 [Gemmatimonadetes bacterium]|nr:MAG: hypothetical protein DMD42_05895 [Gemmatimonadota bacterium]
MLRSVPGVRVRTSTAASNEKSMCVSLLYPRLKTGYGIGWFVRTDSLGHRWAFHGGGSVGGTTAFGLDRDSHVVVAILTNLTDAPLEPAQEIEAAFER